jgi:hypothetical protein
VQNVEHNHNVQSHEIPNLSLDCWRVSVAVNASNDASHVHTVVKDSKAIQVKRLSVAHLEGSCGDFGRNGLEGYFRPEESDLQHLTQNGHSHNVQSHEIPDVSLDCWRVSAVVNASDDAPPVHTIVKDSKAIHVRRLSVADLEILEQLVWKAILNMRRVISNISLRMVGRLAHAKALQS